MGDSLTLAPLAALLHTELEGARIEKVIACPDVRAVVLWLFCNGCKKTLIIATGADPCASIVGVGMLDGTVKLIGDSDAPLSNAMRAHLVDQRVRSVLVEDDILWISAGGSGIFSRLAVYFGRQGGAICYGSDGTTSTGFANKRELVAGLPPVACAATTTELKSAGDRLLQRITLERREREYREYTKLVRAELAASVRRQSAIGKDYERVSSVKTLQKIGRLLMHQASSIAPGSTHAILQDWEDGGELRVELDPARPARAQADGYFAKATRFKRSEPLVRDRLAQAAARTAALTALSEQCQNLRADDQEGWQAFVSHANSLGIHSSFETQPRASLSAAAPAPLRKPDQESERRVPYHTFFDARGRKILVGRGAKDNDTLTTEIAKPHDLWLHVKNQHGAHVVVPLQKGHNVEPETLVDAATLAAHFSDARGETVCEVSYVAKRYVRKPRGSNVGSVTLDQEKVLVLRLEPKRLERLLADSKAPR